MPDFPSNLSVPIGGTITSSSDCALAGSMGSINMALAAWPAASLAIYVPFTLELSVTAYKMWWENGATVAGNVDVALYDRNWNRLVSAGSTAMSGVSAAQIVDVADTALSPGRYFLAMSSDSATATFRRASVFNGLPLESLGVQQQDLGGGNVALPSTATPANPANAYVPFIGVVVQSSVF